MTRPHTARPRAFTLIELLVVIGVIGLIISIVLPALGGARAAAREAKALANLRSTGQTFAAYANQYKALPFRALGSDVPGIAGDGAVSGPIPGQSGIIFVRWWPNGVLLGTSDVWSHQWIWPGIVSSFMDWPEAYATWVSPGRSTELPTEPIIDMQEIANTISIRYACPFVASPQLFREGAPADESLIGPTRPENVRFPAGKVMLWDAHLAYLRRQPAVVGEFFDAPAPMAFADGHAEVRNPTQAAPGVTNPLRHVGPSPINSTKDGTAGKDF